MLELVIVIAIALVMGGLAFISTREVLRSQRGDSALQNVLAITRTTRQLAIDRRRVFRITYSPDDGTMQVQVTAPTNSAGGCTSATEQWPDAPAQANPAIKIGGSYSFAWVAGAPNSTTTAPDGITAGGAATPVAFVNPAGASNTYVCFYPDGSARDVNNLFMNGIVYLAPSSTSEGNFARTGAMRAMTVFGPTGRITGWRISQSTAGANWKQW
jgi:Tfp pilus assembly protein FimT